MKKSRFTGDVQEFRDAGPGGLGSRYFREAATVLGQVFWVATAKKDESDFVRLQAENC